jgi:tetratricopeptide (TPR) repeat protein
VHTSVDWLHLLPGVTAFALVACAVLLRNRAPVRAPSPVRMARGRRLAPVALIALALIVAGASLSRQYLSERFRSEGQDALVERPEEALRQADRSLRLDPEAVESYYLKAAALARFDQAGAARDALREAARREPRNFVTWALLGDLAVRSGNMAVAKQNYRRALALNPRDVGLRQHVRDAAR